VVTAFRAGVAPSRRTLALAAALIVANATVFLLIAEDVLDGGGLVSHDEVVLTWFVDHRTDAIISAARLVSTLGGFASLFVVGLLLGGWLWRRGWHAALAVAPVVALILGSLASTTAKALFDRARPPVELHATTVTLAAFPSGHATDAAAFFLGASLTLALTICQRGSRQLLVIAAGIALAGTVGISRLVLAVHWLSDVVAGWALGTAIAIAVTIAAWWLVSTRTSNGPRRAHQQL
jgi:membrane-associated phospholipid phosphatase